MEELLLNDGFPERIQGPFYIFSSATTCLKKRAKLASEMLHSAPSRVLRALASTDSFQTSRNGYRCQGADWQIARIALPIFDVWGQTTPTASPQPG